MGVPRGIAGRSLTYDDEDRLVTVGDDDGFLKKKTDGSDMTEYAYSSRGELLRVELPDGKVIEYVHDPLGRRIAKKVNGTVTEKYLWQGLTRLLAVYNADETLKMRFEYADARMPLAMTKDGVTYYLGYDQVGTLKVVADASGTVVKRIEYDTFGNILSDSDASFAVPFGFAGGLCDKDTGLVRFGYRDYDPETGRWTAKDPILFAGGDTDLYGYCLNNPVGFIDHDGRKVSIIRCGPHPSVRIENADTSLTGQWSFGPDDFSDFADILRWLLGGSVEGVVRWETTDAPRACSDPQVIYDFDWLDQTTYEKIVESFSDPPDYSWIRHNCIDWMNDMIGMDE